MKPVRVVKPRNNAVLLALLGIAGIVAIVFLYNLWTNHVWTHEIERLKTKATNLYLVVEQQKTALSELKNRFGDLNVESNSSLLSNDNATLLEKLNALKDEVTKTKLDLQTNVDSVKSYAENTYQGLNNLGERFQNYIKEAQVNLADHCSMQIEHCSVPSSSNQGSYWKSCRTSRAKLSVPVRTMVIEI